MFVLRGLLATLKGRGKVVAFAVKAEFSAHANKILGDVVDIFIKTTDDLGGAYAAFAAELAPRGFEPLLLGCAWKDYDQAAWRQLHECWAHRLYLQCGLDPALRYEAFGTPPGLATATRIAVPDREYIVIHDDERRRMDRSLVPEGTAIVHVDDPSIRRDDLFAYVDLLEGASEFHGIDSTFFAMIDQLEIPVRKTCHAYVRGWTPPDLWRDTRYLCTTKTAVVMGAAGQDGSYLCELLLERGYTAVIGVVRRSSAPKLDNLRHCLTLSWRFSVEYADLTDSASICAILKRHKPTELYNLAAQSHVAVSFATPESTLTTNAMGVLNCLEAIRTVSPSTKMYQAGTSEMFGSSPPPQSETTPMNPGSPYACAKLYAHAMVKNYRDAYGLFVCSGILFNHESPRRGEDFVTRKITLAAARIAKGLQTELRLGNLEAERDWGYAPEYVDAMQRLLQLDEPRDLVIGTGTSHSIRDFIGFVSEAAGFDVMKHVVADESMQRPYDVHSLRADAAEAARVIGWKPSVLPRELARIMYRADFDSV
jgi:GDPmannose 4,6-dehydratase